MTFKEYIKWLFTPRKINNYTNNPRYYSSSRWLEGGQDVRTEMSITEVEKDNAKKFDMDNPTKKALSRGAEKA